MREHHHIIRHSLNCTWVVRIYGNTIIKCFADTKFGGKKRALNAAIAWRDKTLVEINYKGNFSSGFVSSTKILGVQHRFQNLYSKCRGKRFGPYLAESIIALWWNPKTKKRHVKSFSVRKYGKERAVELATAAYAKMKKAK